MRNLWVEFVVKHTEKDSISKGISYKSTGVLFAHIFVGCSYKRNFFEGLHSNLIKQK